ncbi:ABC transporter permease [Mycoplasmopsis lipofaciens]|uniref:ABC transporter permease n=1 Tax=Mycoplasmopsis lipofaciens TaxID=114884 RepID=UPI00047F99B2|nr:ABC transporter permease [Mycoplasmopsis lipofaciens]
MKNKTIIEPSFKSKVNNNLQKISTFFKLEKNKKAKNRIMASVWSLIFGLGAAMIYIFISTAITSPTHTPRNPFLFFAAFGEVFKYSNSIQRFGNYFIIFGFTGLASAIGFRSGLFNIGISGQMTAGSIICFSIIASKDLGDIKLAHLIIYLIIYAFVGFLLGLFSGILKAYLNIHEVISTILMNWILVGIASYIFQLQSNSFGPLTAKYIDPLNGGGVLGGPLYIQKEIKELFSLILSLSLIVIGIGLWIMYKFTTLGYKLRMLGLSKTNGQYIGVNDKLLTSLILGFSGLLAGIGGFFYYMIFETKFIGIQSPLVIGFESIAIALLALNAPLGVMLISLFYSILYTSRIYTTTGSLNILKEDLNVITSIILYFASISQILLQFTPGKYVWKKIILLSRKSWRAKMHIYWLRKKKQRVLKKYRLHKSSIQQNITIETKALYLNKYIDYKLKYETKIKQIEAKELFYLKKVELMQPIIDLINEINKLRKEYKFQNKEQRNNIDKIKHLIKLINKNYEQTLKEKDEYKLSELNKKIDLYLQEINLQKDLLNEVIGKKGKQFINDVIEQNKLKRINSFNCLNEIIKNKKHILKENKIIYQNMVNHHKNICKLSLKQWDKNKKYAKNYLELNLKSFDQENIKKLNEQTSYIFDINQFEIETTSFKKQIKLANKNYKKHKNDFLKIALNSKNNDETIENFSKISDQHRALNDQLRKLKKSEKQDIKLQYKAQLKENKNLFKLETNKIYEFYLNNYILMPKEYRKEVE